MVPRGHPVPNFRPNLVCSVSGASMSPSFSLCSSTPTWCSEFLEQTPTYRTKVDRRRRGLLCGFVGMTRQAVYPWGMEKNRFAVSFLVELAHSMEDGTTK